MSVRLDCGLWKEPSFLPPRPDGERVPAGRVRGQRNSGMSGAFFVELRKKMAGSRARCRFPITKVYQQAWTPPAPITNRRGLAVNGNNLLEL